jgi:prepilin-type N-terminal cleavage/methylation domain-containing protein
MLTAPPPTSGRSAASQAGFTLVELLVAISIGTVVIFAVSAIMIVSLHQTQRTFTSVDATRQARTALATIESELHSACVNGDAPIQATSDGSTLNFLSYTGGGPNPKPLWHVLSFSGGTLTDGVYPAVYTATGTGHSWTQGSPQTSQTTLLTNVAQQPRSPAVPVFEYYAYEQAYTSGGDTYWYVADGNNIKPGTTGSTPDDHISGTALPLTAAVAATVVEVSLNLLVGPSGENLANSTLTSEYDPVTDAISLRLTTPPDYVPSGSGTASYLPCQ